jgi:hypothetical protein
LITLQHQSSKSLHLTDPNDPGSLSMSADVAVSGLPDDPEDAIMTPTTGLHAKPHPARTSRT